MPASRLGEIGWLAGLEQGCGVVEPCTDRASTAFGVQPALCTAAQAWDGGVVSGNGLCASGWPCGLTTGLSDQELGSAISGVVSSLLWGLRRTRQATLFPQ